MAILHWLCNPDLNLDTATDTANTSWHQFNQYRKSYQVYTISNQHISLSHISYVFHLGCGWCIQFCLGASSQPSDFNSTQVTYYQAFSRFFDENLNLLWPGRPPNTILWTKDYLLLWIGCLIITVIVLIRIYSFKQSNHWRDCCYQHIRHSMKYFQAKLRTFVRITVPQLIVDKLGKC